MSDTKNHGFAYFISTLCLVIAIFGICVRGYFHLDNKIDKIYARLDLIVSEKGCE